MHDDRVDALQDLIDDGVGGGLAADVDGLEDDVQDLRDQLAHAWDEIKRLRASNTGLLEVVTQLMVNAYTDVPSPPPLEWDDPKVVSIARAVVERAS